MSELTVIIPTYNRSEPLKGTLNSLQETENHPAEVIVVDDSEEDTTQQVCENHEYKINYIRPAKSINLPHARNVALEAAETDIVAFVDDDVRFSDGWCDAILESFQKDDVGAVGGPALEYTEGCLKHARSESNENQNTVTKEGFVDDSSAYWRPSNPVETDTLRGANMAFRKSVLEEIGGFDEGYIGNSFREDTDICVRVKDKGYRIIYDPKAELEHLYIDEGGCRDKNRDFWYSLGYNQRRFVTKNFASKTRLNLIKFGFTWDYTPYSLLKIILSAIKNHEFKRLAYVKGLIGR
ncbi:glycosyltransferase family 2 protein [Candidatus Nanohalococcus occultus]|uniref:Glycosyl transferase family 2 n=1 Tax=Candidatus Nanohalococcus occultus TaxID=2978047 RepID=A0ABY8CFR9_9ARCH|nr:Glycosyl transferase family 2 [Candidatus Nanohaloarchaeota archaeon SVXNc]